MDWARNRRDHWLPVVVSLALSARYYAQHARNTGLLGKGAVRVWRDRFLARPCLAGADDRSKRPRLPRRSLRSLLAMTTEARVIMSLRGGRKADAAISGASADTCYGPPEEDRPLWVHIAGPGDARAGLAFVRAFSALMPTLPVYVTCGTVPAFRFVQEHAAPNRIGLGWFPFDTPRIMLNFLRRLQPRVFVSAQGEFWPNLIRELHRAGIPSIFLRVDMLDWATQTEFPRWVRPWYEAMLSLVTRFSVRAPIYRDRLVRCGVAECRILVGGDYRFEALPAPRCSGAETYAGLFGLSRERPLVVLATWRLDEVRSVVRELAEPIRGGRLRLVIAPSEIDACRRTERLLQSGGFPVVRRSALRGAMEGPRIVLLDTHGELFDVYAAATATILGDTFPPAFSVGANLWEPLVQGVPVVYGPELPVSPAVQLVEQAGVARRVHDYGELARALNDVLRNPPAREFVQQVAASITRNAPLASELDAHAVFDLLNGAPQTGARMHAAGTH